MKIFTTSKHGKSEFILLHLLCNKIIVINDFNNGNNGKRLKELYMWHYLPFCHLCVDISRPSS